MHIPRRSNIPCHSDRSACLSLEGKKLTSSLSPLPQASRSQLHPSKDEPRGLPFAASSPRFPFPLPSVIPAGPPLSCPPVVSGNPVSCFFVSLFVGLHGKTMDSRLTTSGMTEGRFTTSGMTEGGFNVGYDRGGIHNVGYGRGGIHNVGYDRRGNSQRRV